MNPPADLRPTVPPLNPLGTLPAPRLSLLPILGSCVARIRDVTVSVSAPSPPTAARPSPPLVGLGPSRSNSPQALVRMQKTEVTQ